MSKPGTETAQVTVVEPARIKGLRRDLIKAIPRFPNNRASLRDMEAQSVGELLIHYISWRSRYVGERPRTYSISPAAKAEPRWSAHEAAIKAFSDKVERGDDLTPHLSIEPHTRGYAAAARAAGARPDDRWSDKDELLNIMGFHHFHLDSAVQPGGHVNGPDDLIFAEVSRNAFKVIAIFGHEVFDDGSAERMRLWALHESIITQCVAPDTVVVSAAIAQSGHPLCVVQYAQECACIIRDIEPKLDDPEFVKSLYNPPAEAPAKAKLSWGFIHLDLTVEDASKPVMIFKQGWN
jgi:hypothetical protein